MDFKIQGKQQAVLGISLISLGLAIYVVTVLFNAIGLNTGLYATVINTLLPLTAVALVASGIISFFR